jgi:hypothetical protein
VGHHELPRSGIALEGDKVEDALLDLGQVVFAVV